MKVNQFIIDQFLSYVCRFTIGENNPKYSSDIHQS